MPDLRSLEVFFWVASLGSFRRASERLNTTQPAVSQRIAGLEAELGTRLFDRAPRAVTMTAKGRELFDYADRMLRLHADMVRAVSAPAAMSGLVRLGASETVVHTWLPRFIERVHARYPGVILDIGVETSPNLREALIAHEIDLAFLLGPVSDPRMINRELSRYPLAFVARADADLPDGIVPLAEIVKRPVITYPKTTRPYLALRELLSRPDLPPCRLYSNASLSTIVRMTLDGIGVSAIPPIVIARELAEGSLRVIRTELDLPELVYTATFPRAPDAMIAQTLADVAKNVAEEADAVAIPIRKANRKR